MAKKTVTIDDILKTIERRKTINRQKIRWILDGEDLELKSPGFNIRAKYKFRVPNWDLNSCLCPITFYCLIKTGTFYPTTSVAAAAEKSGLSKRTYHQVIKAADSFSINRHLNRTRKRLLKITSLLEQARKNGEKV